MFARQPLLLSPTHASEYPTQDALVPSQWFPAKWVLIWIKAKKPPPNGGSGTYQQPPNTAVLKRLFQYTTLDDTRGIS